MMNEWNFQSTTAQLELFSWLAGVLLISILGSIALILQRKIGVSSQARVAVIRAALVASLVLPLALLLFPATGLVRLSLRNASATRTISETVTETSTGREAILWPETPSAFQPVHPADDSPANDSSSLVEMDGPREEASHGPGKATTESSNLMEGTPTPLPQESLDRQPAWSVNPLFVIGWALAGLWCVGTVFCLSRLAGFWWLTWRLRIKATAAPASLSPMKSVFDNRTAVRINSQLRFPMVVGVWKSVILLPVEFHHWDSERQQMVLAHEGAHLSQRDVTWQCLAAITVSVYWWMIPLRWLAAQLRLEQELAADDTVLLSGFSPTRYAETLLELAQGATCEISCPLAVTMASPPLERRVRSLLNPAIARSNHSRPRFIVAGLAFASLLIALVIARPVQSVAAVEQPSSAVSDQEPESAGNAAVETNDQLTGRIVDETGNPVAGATIEYRLIDYDPPNYPRATRILLENQTALSDSQGEFKISVPDWNGNQVLLTGNITRSGFAAATIGSFVSAADRSLEDFVLERGRKITGRVVDASTRQPFENSSFAVFRVNSADGIGVSFAGTANQTSDGKFTLWVSKVGAHRLTIQSPSHCPVSKLVFSDQSELGDIPLQAGAVIQGQAIDLEGRPVAGAVVQLSEVGSSNSSVGSRPTMPSTAVKSDDEGRFQFPPRQPGQYVVGCVEAATSIHSQPLKSAPNLPIIPPQTVSIDSQGQTQPLLLQAVPTIKISGAVRFEDGRPAPGVAVEASCFLPDVNSGNRLDRAFSDQQGKYELEVPKQVSENERGLSIHSMMRHRIGEVVYRSQSRILPTSPAFNRVRVQPNLEAFRLVESTVDLDGVDWVLRPTDFQTGSTKPGDSNDSRNLTAKQQADMLGEWAEIELARNSGNGTDRLQRLLDFEQKYRGQPKAARALFLAISSQRGEWQSDSKQVQQMFDLLLEHYLDLELIDLELLELGEALGDENWIRFFRSIEQQSSNRTIQAVACFVRARSIARAIRFRTVMEDANWKVCLEKEEPDQTESLQIVDLSMSEQPYFKWLYQLLSNLDRVQAKRELNECLQRLERDYADVKTAESQYFLDGNRVRLNPGIDFPTLNEQANRLRFQRFLSNDQVVPEIAGEDMYGHHFSLEKLRGNPVLLIMSGGGQLDPKNLNRIRAIQQQYIPRRLQVVMISGAPRSAIEERMGEGLICWTIAHDEDVGDPAKRWATDVSDDVYLIDENGLLRKQLIVEADIESILEEYFQQ